MQLTVKKTDYRFSANNYDYMPETNECEMCGDYMDDEHYYMLEGVMMCEKCYTKELDNIEWYKCDDNYLLNGGTK